MPTTYKVLGQAIPANGNFSTLASLPLGATDMIVSSISVCNIANTNTYRIAVIPFGETISSKHYIVYNSVINANDSCILTVGITLRYGDEIRVRGPDLGISSIIAFSAFGAIIT